LETLRPLRVDRKSVSRRIRRRRLEADGLRSTSSSSAISIGREVQVPCPISTFGITSITRPLGAMRTKALSTPLPAGLPDGARLSPRTATPITSAPVTAAEVTMNRRRVSAVPVVVVMSAPPAASPV
jgi:hypothetical protein